MPKPARQQGRNTQHDSAETRERRRPRRHRCDSNGTPGVFTTAATRQEPAMQAGSGGVPVMLPRNKRAGQRRRHVAYSQHPPALDTRDRINLETRSLKTSQRSVNPGQDLRRFDNLFQENANKKNTRDSGTKWVKPNVINSVPVPRLVPRMSHRRTRINQKNGGTWDKTSLGQ